MNTSLSSSAMLVDLNLSVWTARKMDKKVSAEIDSAKQTRARAGNYNKSLLAGTNKLEEITKLASAIRTWHYGITLPWSDLGSRLLPTSLFMDYKRQLAIYEQDFNVAVLGFLSEYNTLISAAAFTLGNLFDRNEYPDLEVVRDKFAFRYAFLPVPEAGDFRVDIPNEGLLELQKQYEGLYEHNVQTAMSDTWDRLFKALNALSERLATDEAGKNKIFRDSLVTNAQELCDILKALNITNDVGLEAMRKQLQDTLSGVEAQDLRDDDYMRRKVKSTVDDMLSKWTI